MNPFLREMLSGVLLLALGLWIWWYSGRFPSLPEGYPGPSLFPKVVSAGLSLSALALLIVGVVSRKQLAAEGKPEDFDRKGLLRMLAGLGLVGVYPIIQPLVGFALALGVICFLVALLLRAGVLVAAGTAALTVLFIYLIFITLLGLSL